MEGAGMLHKKLEKIKIRLEELQTEIIGESDETVHGMQEKVRSILIPMIGPHWKLNTSIIYEFGTGSANYLVRLKKPWNG